MVGNAPEAWREDGAGDLEPWADSLGELGSGSLPLHGCGFYELAVFPQATYSVAQGLVGVRRWYLNGSTDLDARLRQICASHWPGFPDCRPVSVQVGAPDDKVKIYPVDNINWNLPKYNQYLIVAQYQLLHITDPWPITGQPAHPKGSVLTLQIRGGAEMLEIDPTAMTSGAGAKGLTGCFNGIELAPNTVFNSRIRVSLTEYHIVCDRLTDKQLCDIMTNGDGRGWRVREGTVNSDPYSRSGGGGGGSGSGGPGGSGSVAPGIRATTSGRFMNEAEGTLLFDTWTLDQTFAPDVDNPRRWRLGCVLKCRQVPEMKGPYPDNCRKPQYAVGWNHDFKRDTEGRLGWQFIMMECAGSSSESRWTPHGTCLDCFVPRYPYREFADLFCDESRETCEPAEDPTCHNEPEIIERTVADAQGVAQRKALRDEG